MLSSNDYFKAAPLNAVAIYLFILVPSNEIGRKRHAFTGTLQLVLKRRGIEA
jgi:hypothetical protein